MQYPARYGVAAEWPGQRKPSGYHLKEPALISCHSSLFDCCSEFTDLIPKNAASINARLEAGEAGLGTTNTLLRMTANQSLARN
jgi:hypothetical protein